MSSIALSFNKLCNGMPELAIVLKLKKKLNHTTVILVLIYVMCSAQNIVLKGIMVIFTSGNVVFFSLCIPWFFPRLPQAGPASGFQWALHLLTLPWKLIFAMIPPVDPW